MMISGATYCYPNGQQAGGIPIYGTVSEEMIASNRETNQPTNRSSFLNNLSLLKEKVYQVESLSSIFFTTDHNQQPESTAVVIPTMGILIHEIITTASSMMIACQQLSFGTTSTNVPGDHTSGANRVVDERAHDSNYSDHHGGAMIDPWYGENYNCNSNTDGVNVSHDNNEACGKNLRQKREITERSIKNYDIIELEAADLLAKYTHYCPVCGKGFKRDANLRMHMRAHGNEYKPTAALSNPVKITSGANNNCSNMKLPKKYSCPQEGCRWNKNHAKFQPLKSMICVKNHYKRSHCPKMYVCKRCHKKSFSVLSDLRTHEKHCGDLKWQCSCGTTFSRKDKLIGHVALFIGHAPAINLNKIGLEVKPQS